MGAGHSFSLVRGDKKYCAPGEGEGRVEGLVRADALQKKRCEMDPGPPGEVSFLGVEKGNGSCLLGVRRPVGMERRAHAISKQPEQVGLDY